MAVRKSLCSGLQLLLLSTIVVSLCVVAVTPLLHCAVLGSCCTEEWGGWGAPDEGSTGRFGLGVVLFSV